ncbi:MAG: sensor histidine kinase [Phycisphaerae bacterium]
MDVPSDKQTLLEAFEARFDEAVQQLEMLKRQLEESQRLATVGTMTAIIAHEFNNILTPIVSYSQFALASAESDNPDMELIRKALTKCYAGSSKAGRICSSLLNLTRGESYSGDVDLQKLVEDTLLVMARDPAKDGIALRLRVPPGLAVQGDAVQLEQVLLNLLINARQAMLGRGGSLTVVAGLQPDGWVTLSVADTGPGVPADLAERIFEPFFTTKTPSKRSAGGNGLGLALCREIVEHHGGRITLDSAPGRGATFTLYLPAANAQTKAA